MTLLGPGLPLAEGEKLVEDFGASLSREQTDYISGEHRGAKTAQTGLKKRIRYAVMAAISVLAIAAGFQWFQAERQRRERKKPKRLNLKHRSLRSCRNSCGRRVGQASTKPSVSSSWESGGKASLFLRVRSSSTRKIKLLQNDSSKN